MFSTYTEISRSLLKLWIHLAIKIAMEIEEVFLCKEPILYFHRELLWKKISQERQQGDTQNVPIRLILNDVSLV